MSHYHVNALALIGAVIICLTYPNVVSTALQFYDGFGSSIAAVVQINMWFAVAGSIVGVFIINSLTFNKINVHDVIFVSLAGAIAFSSSSSVNFNPGAAIAIGSGIGFICALIHTPFKRWMNEDGVRESNSVIVQFIIPGTFACIFSSILQAVNQNFFNVVISGTQQLVQNKDPTRNPSEQAGWQLMGFVFSLGSSLICALILGIIMRCAHNNKPHWYFNDLRFFSYGDEGANYEDEKRLER